MLCYRYLKKLLRLLSLLYCLSGCILADEKKEDSYGEIIMEHISDSHEWHFFSIGDSHYSIPLPILIYKERDGFYAFSSSDFKDKSGHWVEYMGFEVSPHSQKIISKDGVDVYDFSFTKNSLNLLLVILLILIIFGSFANYTALNGNKAHKGFWVLLMLLVLFVRDQIAIENIGKKKYRKFTPFLLTLFFLIWVSNTLGLFPGAANVTGNFSASLVIAIITLIFAISKSTKYYWSHIFNPPGIPYLLLPLMVPMELLGLVSRTLSMMMRLFINIFAGHLVLLSIIGIIFKIKTLSAAVTVAFVGTIVLLLKFGVAFFQAYLFTYIASVLMEELSGEEDKELLA